MTEEEKEFKVGLKKLMAMGTKATKFADEYNALADELGIESRVALVKDGFWNPDELDWSEFWDGEYESVEDYARDEAFMYKAVVSSAWAPSSMTC